MKTIQLYYQYFLHQAMAHVALQHDAAVGGRVFAVVDIDEALGDFRSGAKHQGYIMRLINYTYVVGQVTHEATKEIQGGFIIAKYYNAAANGSQAYLTAMSDTERVVDDIIVKMIADSRAGHPLFDNYFDAQQDINVQPVNSTGDGTYCGWMVIFRSPQFFDNCIHPDLTRWTDGGVTPVPDDPEGDRWELGASGYWLTNPIEE